MSHLHLRSTSDLLAAIPYVLGFHPADCIVLVALRGRSLHFVLRFDLPGPAPGVIAALVGGHGADRAAVVGYGPEGRVRAVLPALAAALRLGGLEVVDEIRVTDGRYWSPRADAAPFDVDATVVAATATFQGLPALPSREAMVAQLAPVTGDGRAAMSAATARAEARLGSLTAAAARAEGFSAVRDAEAGRALTDDQVAWLSVLLAVRDVHDYAWGRCEPRPGDQALWTDVVRRAEPSYVAPPAILLAFVAWRRGLGPLAGAAVDRALAADRRYRPAILMDEILRSGVSPAAADSWPGRAAA